MAVRVIRKIPSRGFKITGSLTRSTSTLFFPCQQSAFTIPPEVLIARQSLLGLHFYGWALVVKDPLGGAGNAAGSNRLSFGGGNFSRFHQLLDLAQTFAHQLLGIQPCQ